MTKAMRKLAAACVLLAAGSVAMAQVAVVQSVRGEAQARSGSGPLARLSAGQSVDTGTQLVTGNGGEAVVRFSDGHMLALKDNSTVTIASYVYDQQRPAASSFAMELLRGGLRSVTGLLGKGNPQAFRLTTPVSTVGIRGSDWVAALDGNTLYTGVTNGGIVVNNPANSLLVDAGQFSATTGAGASQVVPFSQLPAGVFGSLPQVQMASGGAGAGGATAAASGGITGTQLLLGAGLLGAAAAAGSGSGSGGSGTTGTTGTTN